MIEAVHLEKEVFLEMGIGLPELVMEPPIEMRGLSRVVVLAGPNGAGKSRLLRLLPGITSKKLSREQLEALDERDESLSASLGERHQAYDLLMDEPFPEQNPELDHIGQQIGGLTVELRNLSMQRRMSDAVTLSRDEVPRFARFVPAGYQLSDPFGWSQMEADSRAAQLAHRIDTSQQDAPAYVARVFRIATERGYERFRRGEVIPCEAERQLDSLLKLLQHLLGSELTISVEGGRLKIGAHDPFNQALSPGQQLLFQFGCLLHAQVGHVENAIVLMDEPENHLHPGVLIEVIDTLKTLLADGQLWIATHSVPLIAHLMSKDPDCLWFVNEGKVKRAGRTPEVVLESLLGGPKGANDLQALTRLPESYAANRFLSECLLAPGVVGPDVKDPQTLQIQEALWSKLAAAGTSGGKLRILDFGAGKGRLLATLVDSLKLGQTLWFDYIAFDVGDEDKADCEAQISAIYGNADNRWFNDLSTLQARVDTGSIDAVVMCNVLHEVPPGEWPSTLPACAKLLKSGGGLLLVEDYGIQVGERAHEYGFLLLDEPELVELFEIRERDRREGAFQRTTSAEPRYKDRLVAHFIEKSCVARVSSATRRAAIEKLRERMEQAVQHHLQNPKASGSIGRSYARSTQLLANASLWCKANA